MGQAQTFGVEGKEESGVKMDEPTEWRKLIFDSGLDAPNKIGRIQQLARFRYDQSESETEREGFAVYSKTLLPEGQHTPLIAIYFSPTAARLCSADMERGNLSWEPCGTPELSDELVTLLAGRRLL